MAEYKPYKMKGHTLPGINQRSEGDTDLPDGRSGSAAFQYKSPAKEGKTTFVDKVKAAGQTFVEHLDPDEKIGGISDTYKLKKKQLREKKKEEKA